MHSLENEKMAKCCEEISQIGCPQDGLQEDPVTYSQYIDRRMLFGVEIAMDWAFTKLEIEEH